MILLSSDNCGFKRVQLLVLADQQVKRLYGREVAVFPPPGLSCDDAYFARTVPLEQRPGRIYVGYLAPMLNRQQCLAPLAAALLLAPYVLFEGDQHELELLDAWWTQVVYHGRPCVRFIMLG